MNRGPVAASCARVVPAGPGSRNDMLGEMTRRRLRVCGVVQGVGFRPFVYRIAHEEALAGFVRNEARGVLIEAIGTPAALTRFTERLARELPAPGRVDRVSIEEESLVEPSSRREFIIEASQGAATRSMALAPDGRVCPACLAEMADPANRRHRHPFITCTLCGPRYTITRDLPYDRPNTTLARFPMCRDCRREYDDPGDRRYHAQPIACPVCGPRAWLVEHAEAASGSTALAAPPPGSLPAPPDAAIVAAHALLKAGRVLAVKGLGGFHLAVDARNDAAVAELRARKRRPHKPLAVMAKDLATARRLVVLDDATAELLASYAAPIVLAPARPDHGLAAAIAPGLCDLGVMLPYTPLHHLLFGADGCLDDDGRLDALVMTSGNAPSEPITIDNAAALASLPADAYLLHDREICVACDDSVVRTGPVGGPTARRTAPIMIRRARGFVPGALSAAHLPRRWVLALGAELKVTVATLHEGELVVGRHLGDLDNPLAEAAYRQEIERMLRFGGVAPEAVAVDRHPDLFSSRHAEEHFGHLPIVRVQHHHAHMAAVMTEHGIAPDVEVAAIVLDGLGYGDDGAIWGGEVLTGTYATARRFAHLRYVPQPGGDRAAVEPWRMATSLLIDAGLASSVRLHESAATALRAVSAIEAFDRNVAAICGVRAVSPLTSSTGRLFDGVAALLGLAPRRIDYEGEAAARLEAAADPRLTDAYPLPLADAAADDVTGGGATGAGAATGTRTLDTRALVSALLADHAPVAARAARFHAGLARGLAEAALATGRGTIVLAGGSMVNRLLSSALRDALETAGARVIGAERLPPGDGGLAAGQAACAACTLTSSVPEGGA